MDREKRNIRRYIFLSKSEADLIDKAALKAERKPADWVRLSVIRAAKAMGLNGKGAKR